MKKKVKDFVPYLIIAQTAMLSTITIATVIGSLSTPVFDCRMVSHNRVICIQKQKSIMQKVINVIALLSGLTSLSLIAGTGYLLMNKDSMIEDAKKSVANAAVEAVSGALPGLIDAAMPEVPEIPTSTGAAIPSSGVNFP